MWPCMFLRRSRAAYKYNNTLHLFHPIVERKKKRRSISSSFSGRACGEETWPGSTAVLEGRAVDRTYVRRQWTPGIFFLGPTERKRSSLASVVVVIRPWIGKSLDSLTTHPHPSVRVRCACEWLSMNVRQHWSRIITRGGWSWCSRINH